MRKAVYAGTFDPFTNGHMDIVLRARKLFDEIILLVAVPPTKNPFLEAQERLSLIEDLFKNDKGIKVEKWAGLVVDFAKKNKINFLVRGLRPTGDFDSEFQMATMNEKLLDSLETVFFVTGEDHYYISSSLIKEIYNHGGDISNFVPKSINEALKAKRKS